MISKQMYGHLSAMDVGNITINGTNKFWLSGFWLWKQEVTYVWQILYMGWQANWPTVEKIHEYTPNLVQS